MSGRPYEIEVATGQPVEAVLAAARDRNSDLIVVGTGTRPGWQRAILGSVSGGILHGSRCPVVTVASHDRFGSPMRSAITKIICPVNFTEAARESLQVATRIAEAFGAHLFIVHVLEKEESLNVMADEERVRRWVDFELQHNCSYRELVLRGGAAERVLDCADDLGADLLVIGAQHRTFRDLTVIGTTSERLVRFASCPVLVVPLEAVPAVSKETKETDAQRPLELVR